MAEQLPTAAEQAAAMLCGTLRDESALPRGTLLVGGSKRCVWNRAVRRRV
jgi:hypothetical protein